MRSTVRRTIGRGRWDGRRRIATVLGAGHSVDLMAHRVVSLLESTPLRARVTVERTGGCDYQPNPTATWQVAADGGAHDAGQGGDVARDVGGVARHQVVDAHDLGVFGEQSLAQVRPDEPCASEDDDARTGACDGKQQGRIVAVGVAGRLAEGGVFGVHAAHFTPARGSRVAGSAPVGRPLRGSRCC